MERLTVGQLAKLARVNLETVRYYERCGLLPQPPRLSSGYRAFPVVSVERIRFIKQAQELGFSLKEIKELLALQIDPNSTGADVKKSAEAKINDIEAKIKTLSAMKKALVKLKAACNGNGPISECPILESIGSEK
ncbi:MAG: MerR family DNA-binding protein [Acidobacteria bacterium]|jgi:MerR family mercuric resistance operon transcriptional regulator|nr:MerR family DNA-binding protein [Acidobacteriota bacterium]MBA4184127.1 MerR family DNA-binding protein [Acidobacteriota bacterium]